MTVQKLDPTSLIDWLVPANNQVTHVVKRSMISKVIHLSLTAIAATFLVLAKSQHLALRFLPFPILALSFYTNKQVTSTTKAEDPIREAFVKIMTALNEQQYTYQLFENDDGSALTKFEQNRLCALFGKKRDIPFVIMKFSKGGINRCRLILSEDPNCAGKLKLQGSPINNNTDMVKDLSKHHLPSFKGDIYCSSFSFITHQEATIATFSNAPIEPMPQVKLGVDMETFLTQAELQRRSPLPKKHTYHHIDFKLVDEICELIRNTKSDQWLLQRSW
ncbi:MAG: hypothetical protein P0S95_00230 [Rhabdochlamydiaceae bacterium]|nr:hypothetical protein [Candidatus Amphrikana amoebophyrae]